MKHSWVLVIRRGRVTEIAWPAHFYWSYVCHKLGNAIFEWPLRVWMDFLRKGAYRDFLHIILKHTQKATSWYQKYLHRRKGGKVMIAQICVQISVKFRWFQWASIFSANLYARMQIFMYWQRQDVSSECGIYLCDSVWGTYSTIFCNQKK